MQPVLDHLADCTAVRDVGFLALALEGGEFFGVQQGLNYDVADVLFQGFLR